MDPFNNSFIKGFIYLFIFYVGWISTVSPWGKWQGNENWAAWRLVVCSFWLFCYSFTVLFIRSAIYLLINLSICLSVYQSIFHFTHMLFYFIHTILFFIGSKDLSRRPQSRPCPHTGYPNQQGRRQHRLLHLQTRLQVGLHHSGTTARPSWSALWQIFFRARLFWLFIYRNYLLI